MLTDLSWVVIRHEIDYKMQAFEADDITSTTWVGEWTRVTCERFTEIRRRSELLVSARTLWCLVGRKSGRPKRIDPKLAALFG